MGLEAWRARPGLAALALTLPLVAFLLVNFLLPLGTLLGQSFYEPHVAETLPETVAALGGWQGDALPGEAAFAAMATELLEARRSRTLGRVARRLDRDMPGLGRMVTRSAHDLARAERTSSWRATMAEIHGDWAELATWRAVRAASKIVTEEHFLDMFGLARDAGGDVRLRPAEERVYLPRLRDTLLVGLATTLLCLAMGYPLAFVIAHARRSVANAMLAVVALCLLTSLLVRTTAWIVLLQYRGVANNLLVATGLVADDGRLLLIYNMSGTIVAMTHALLPYMVLALYPVMRSIPAVQLRAAASLGATPLQTFLRVYLPLSMPGVGAGSLLVFILAVGQYVTPALLGEQSGQTMSNLIAHHMQTSLNWGMAAAIGTTLLAAVIVLYLLYEKLFGTQHLRL